MKERTFRILLLALTGLFLLLTIAHLGYAAYAYRHSSIVQFIAGELW